MAIATLSAVTRIAAPARERKRLPGITQRVTAIARTRVEPAKAVVRPAVWRVRQAAPSGSAPAASSSRKRETIKRA